MSVPNKFLSQNIPTVPGITRINSLSISSTPSQTQLFGMAQRTPRIIQEEKKTQQGAIPGLILPRAIPNAVPLLKREQETVRAETIAKEMKLPLLTIVRSSISLYSWETMQRMAGRIKLDKYDFGNGTDNGTDYGMINDNRMGEISLSVACKGCQQIDCPGHYGLIDFETLIYNPSHIREVISVLSCVCNSCGSLLITEQMWKENNFNKMSYETRLAAMEKYCLGRRCLNQHEQIGIGVIEECKKNPIFITADIKEKGTITYNLPDDKTPHPMKIEEVESIFKYIKPETALLLGFPKGSHPKDMIMKGLLVPPVIARPPVREGGGIHHDQLTHMYTSIIRKVANIGNTKSKDAVQDLYTSVKQLMFNPEKKKMGMREFLSIIERIQGKNALLRNLLMGKRDDYCGRTVAGPDPSLKFGQIRIPDVWAPILTKKIRVTDFNKEALTILLKEGKIDHITPKRKRLRGGAGPNYRFPLEIGDIVERWLQNGDRVMANRQPTLHRQSMTSHEVVLGHQLSVGFHMSDTTPKNLDFDGDEVNIWDPQDFEVEAEADIIINVKENLMSAEQNRPSIALVMNIISGSYLLTHKDTYINDDLFAELLSMINDKESLKTLYSRLIKYGIHPRSGKAIFSSTLPPDFYYNQKGVLIMEGILIMGQLKKGHIGTSHNSIVQELYKNYGAARTSDFLTVTPWIVNKWLMERGFTVGMTDLINLGKEWVMENGIEKELEYDRNIRVLDRELSNIYIQLEALGGKSDESMEEDFRQRQINNLVNLAQGIGIKLAKDVLAGNNAIGTMTDQGAGTKGGIANIGQILGAIAQQNYKGERLKATLSRGTRLLPVFDENDNHPVAHAFIPVSFFTGVSPEGVFFLQAGCRESLLDVALNVSLTGSIQHRMIKAFENIVVAYDGSVRNTVGTLFATTVGYDVGEMIAVEEIEKPNFSSFIDVKNIVSYLNVKRGWVPKGINASVTTNRIKLENHTENVMTLPNPDYVKGPSIKDTKIIDVTKLPLPKRQHSKIMITKFEKSRIIGTRATQLSHNAKPLVPIDDVSEINIANKEYDAGKLSHMYIVRKFPDGTYLKVHPTIGPNGTI